MSLLGLTRRNEVDPDVISYSTGISACEKGQQWARALGLLREMSRIQLQPRMTTLSSIASSRNWCRHIVPSLLWFHLEPLMGSLHPMLCRIDAWPA